MEIVSGYAVKAQSKIAARTPAATTPKFEVASSQVGDADGIRMHSQLKKTALTAGMV